MFGLAKKLNVQSCKNSTGNCTLYVRKVWICRKLKIQNFENSMQNCVHYICTERWDLKINEFPEQRKFKGKLCTLYMYKTSGFVEKLNIQNYENSMGNCVLYMCTKSQDLLKI